MPPQPCSVPPQPGQGGLERRSRRRSLRAGGPWEFQNVAGAAALLNTYRIQW